MFKLFDAGCAVGNGFFPLFEEFKEHLVVNCCDFSPRAVEFVKKHQLFDENKIEAKVCDLVNDEIPFEK